MSKKKMDHNAQHLMMVRALKENVSLASGPALYFLDQVFLRLLYFRQKKETVLPAGHKRSQKDTHQQFSYFESLSHLYSHMVQTIRCTMFHPPVNTEVILTKTLCSEFLGIFLVNVLASNKLIACQRFKN